MSTLLEQASLIMIPSGYKEDVVYSVIPETGAGDLAFTRASNGTRINSAGLVEVVPWNLVQQSENFTSGWTTASGSSVTANTTTAPNGTTTADTFSVATINYSTLYRGIPLSLGIYTQSIYAKKGTKNWLYILDLAGSAGKAWYNLDTGVVGTVASGFTATIESVGNGWYRCVLTQNTNNTPTYFQFGLSDSDNTTTPTSTGTAFIWGAQANIGSTAKPYFPTTDRLNVPRLTYQNGGGGCPSLLLEKQSTNVALYSEQINSTNYNLAYVTSSENSLTSPDGTTNADKIIESTSNSTHAVTFSASLGGTVDSSPYSISVFVKAEGRSQILFYDNNQAVGGISYFNLSTGVVSSGTGKIENYGNGWYRLTIFCLKDNSTNANVQLYLLDSAGNSTYTGNGTSGIGLWGFQVEASSYPTSYISTTSASATRVADACSKTGISSLIGQSQGSVFLDFTISNLSEAGNEKVLWYMKDGGTGERYVTFLNNGQLIYVEATATVIAQITQSGLTIGRHKCAIGYANNDMVFYVNGIQAGTDTSGTPNGFSTFGLQYYSSGASGSQQVNQAILFPTRLTNSELAQLTGNQNYTINQAYATYGVESESPNCVQP